MSTLILVIIFGYVVVIPVSRLVLIPKFYYGYRAGNVKRPRFVAGSRFRIGLQDVSFII